MRHRLPARHLARILTAVLSVAWIGASPAAAQARVERNVIYGMYSGMALLLDVHVPETANGYGVLFVAGSAWTAPLGYNASPLKNAQISDWGPALLKAGYTVFAINHRATPRFRYPEPLEDVQRAIRYIRHNAKQFGIDPARLGGVAGSSGGHLVGLAAMVAAPGIADDPDPVNRHAATLQAVVLRAAPTDMRTMIGGSAIGTAAVVTFVGRLPSPSGDDQAVYRAASPIAHVSPASPPTFLVHGDADDTVPYKQSVAMEAALAAAKVPVKLMTVTGGAHGSDFGTGGKPHQQFPDVLREAVAWLDRYLKPGAARK